LGWSAALADLFDHFSTVVANLHFSFPSLITGEKQDPRTAQDDSSTTTMLDLYAQVTMEWQITA
jgi:hypothetical protein